MPSFSAKPLDRNCLLDRAAAFFDVDPEGKLVPGEGAARAEIDRLAGRGQHYSQTHSSMSPTPNIQAPTRAREAWSRALQDKTLSDLPYRIETNRYGQLVMSYRPNLHGLIKGQLIGAFAENGPREDGHPVSRCPVETSEGIKAPDMAWFSAERRDAVEGDFAAPVAEVCIEFRTDVNPNEELVERRRLYFRGGAEEVWIVSEEGEVEFFGPDGRLGHSKYAPNFPTTIDLS